MGLLKRIQALEKKMKALETFFNIELHKNEGYTVEEKHAMGFEPRSKSSAP